MNTIQQGDTRQARYVLDLTDKGINVTYDALTGELHVSGQEGRSEIMKALVERLAASVVTSHKLTEELHRCLRNN